ncbi:MAG: 4'-phosphopantetheinyl transferase superfamily protein [Catenulisporales bacterium]|nr:4'-phosphopantetheinyl transferase superfamily protein [Catenulisporales bacterium]
MLSSLLPAEVAVAESFDDPEDAVLFPGEEAVIARAVDKRRREYITTRHCARLALAQLGIPPAAIGTGGNREPLWPDGIVGSMTHCAGYRAAAVARSGGAVAGLGVDAEPHAPLPDGVFDTIARPDEVPALAALAAARSEVQWDRLLFSAKESVYKAWFPVARRWLGFEEASLDFAADGRNAAPDAAAGEIVTGTFSARIHQSGAPLTRMSGRWIVGSGLVVTAIAL